MISALVDILAYFAGGFVFAASLNCFAAPSAIAPGGFTGIAAMVHHLFGLPIGMTILSLNIPLFFIAKRKIGMKFIARTLAATVISSFLIDISAKYLPAYHGDTMLAAVYAGVLSGAGLSAIFIRGATTGGSDLLASLIVRRLRHVSFARIILMIDVCVVCASAFVYHSLESPLYAMVAIFISSKTVDSALYGASRASGKTMFIISQKSGEIADKIMSRLGRGATKIKAEGAYSGADVDMLFCALRRQEVYRTYAIVRSVDSDAFIVVGEAGEITGEGFGEIGEKC